MSEATFKFRFWTGPTQVEDVLWWLNWCNRFEAQAGTEHVYGTVRLPDNGQPAQEFAALAKGVLGYDPGFACLEKFS